MSDPFTQHLEKHGLTGLHQEAQTVGYRVRTANGWKFELEYEGGLAKYNQRDYAIKAFNEDERGMAEARAFIQTVKSEIERSREQQ